MHDLNNMITPYLGSPLAHSLASFSSSHGKGAEERRDGRWLKQWFFPGSSTKCKSFLVMQECYSSSTTVGCCLPPDSGRNEKPPVNSWNDIAPSCQQKRAEPTWPTLVLQYYQLHNRKFCLYSTWFYITWDGQNNIDVDMVKLIKEVLLKSDGNSIMQGLLQKKEDVLVISIYVEVWRELLPLWV